MSSQNYNVLDSLDSTQRIPFLTDFNFKGLIVTFQNVYHLFLIVWCINSLYAGHLNNADADATDK